MEINSLKFILFVAVVIIVYIITPKKYKWVTLLVSSYVFYWLNSNQLIIFMLITTLSIYILSLLLGKIDKKVEIEIKSKEKEEKKKLKEKAKNKKKLIVLIALIINLGILGVIKYFNFFSGNINTLLNLFNLNIQIPSMQFILPLGISYYTLQGLSYVIDVYRQKIYPDKNLGRVALFLAFFPQIVEGPIGRYKELATQLYEPNKIEFQNVKNGSLLVLWGFFQKMVIADRLAILVDTVFSNYTQYSGLIVICAILFYTFQIYADFAGCINIVRGVSEIFGITLAENFKRPFFSRSIQEFWRRWNITLGTWLKEYVFYSVAFSKWYLHLTTKLKEKLKKHTHLSKTFLALCPLFFVWFSNGLWHGASWKYIFYGMYYFVIMSMGMLLEPVFKKTINFLKININSKKYKIWQMLRTFILVNIGMLIFRATNISSAFAILKSMFNFSSFEEILNGKMLSLGLDKGEFTIVIISLIIMLIVDFLQEKNYHVREEIGKRNVLIRWKIYYVGIFSIIIFGIYGKDYNPSSFIYGQF